MANSVATNTINILLYIFLFSLLLASATSAHAASVAPLISTFVVDWLNVTAVSKTIPTLQVVNNPMLNRRLSPVADQLFENLHDLQADLVRYVPWFPYPKGGVAELDPPNTINRTTAWSFPEDLQQPFLDTFHAVVTKAGNNNNRNINNLAMIQKTAHKQNRIVINFSTQPTWMFNTTDWSYHGNAGTCDWNYPRGNFVPETTKLVADYYGRLASWIILGSFTDEFGNLVTGGPALGDLVTQWEVFNEPEAEHGLNWQDYLRLYDAVVRAIRRVADPHHDKIQFFGMSLANHNEWDWWNGFLNLENHAPDVQDAVSNGYASFHWYGHVSTRTNISTYTEPFESMLVFLEEVDQIIAIRDRLSPHTKLAVNEAGVIPIHDNTKDAEDLPPIYYNMVAAVYTILVSELSVKGVDVVGSSQYCGCPAIPELNITDRQYPGVSMTNWTSGAGNPRYWALKMYLQQFGPGDRIVASSSSIFDDVDESFNSIYVQGRITTAPGEDDDKFAVIVVNKTPQKQMLRIMHSHRAHATIVDETTHDGPWKDYRFESDILELLPFAVAIVHLPPSVGMPSSTGGLQQSSEATGEEIKSRIVK